MAIVFVDAKTGTTTTISPMPTHQSGDYLLMFAGMGFTTVPTLPAGWTNIATGSVDSAFRLAYKVAASSSETSGTWTSADGLVCASYRGVASIGNNGTPANGSSTTATIPTVTLSVGDGTSWVVSGSVVHDGTAGYAATLVNGNPRRGTADATFATEAMYDTNGGVASFSSTTVSHGGSSNGWYGVSVELVATAALSNAGQFFAMF